MARTRSFTRGVHVSALGRGEAKMRPGQAPLVFLEAAPRYLTQFTADAGDDTAQEVGLLARGSFVFATINHVVLTGGTVAVSLVDPAGVEADIDLVTALDLDTAASATTGAFVTPLAEDRIVEVTVSGGTDGETAILGLDVGVTVPART